MRYPDLSSARIMAFDIETYDPGLSKYGPGVYRRDGNVLGVAIGTDDGFAEYYNVGHPMTSSEEKQRNIKYLRDTLALPVKKLGANILYDMDWVENFLGIKVNGELHDVQIAEHLLDEYSRVSLELLGKKYGTAKRLDSLRNWCKDNDLTGDPRNYLSDMPIEMVSEYAKGDVIAPIEIFKKQWDMMRRQELLTVYHLEAELLPLLLQMRRVGVRIDQPAVEDGIKQLQGIITQKEATLFEKYGEFNVGSGQQIAPVLDRLGVVYPMTDKGNPNIDKDVLTFDIEHPIAQEILDVRNAKKVLGTFFVNAFLGHNVLGRIHTMFNPIKSELGGTKSGRFSSSHPNLQQIPSKEDSFVELCRRVFIPEEDHAWGKIDWSQIEYRLIAHFATGPGSEEVRERYLSDPNTDYHQYIMDLTRLDRKQAKVLNFGIAYAMGPPAMHKKFGWPLEECEELSELYHANVPFIRSTRGRVGKVARQRGHIKTILGRRARMTPDMIENKKEYQMFNRLIQGSAADLMKKAMRDAHREGIFDVIVPHLTVHDELDFSIPKTKEGKEATLALKNIMETCIRLKVPIVADLEIGHNWADVKEPEGEWW